MDDRAFLSVAEAADAYDDVTSRRRARAGGLGDAAISRLVERGVWRTLHRGVFWTRPLPGLPPLRTGLAAARLAAGGGLDPAGVVAGDGACRLWGLPLAGGAGPATELVVPGAHRRRTPGLRVRRTALEPTEVARRDGFPVTTALRTLRDAAAGRPFDDALVLADAALHLGLVRHDETIGLAGVGRAGAAPAPGRWGSPTDGRSPRSSRAYEPS